MSVRKDGTKVKTATSADRLNELFDRDSRNDSAIADYLHVSKQAVCAWRNGTRSPKKSMMLAIADMYNVDIGWLMGFDEGSEENAAQYKELHTIEARKIARAVDKLTPTQRKQALNVIKAMFPQHQELFEEEK